jgi:hypothetical protein
MVIWVVPRGGAEWMKTLRRSEKIIRRNGILQIRHNVKCTPEQSFH